MRRGTKYFLGTVVLVTAVALNHSGRSASLEPVPAVTVPGVTQTGSPCDINGVPCTPNQYQTWEDRNCPAFAKLGYHCVRP